ncbi:MAG: hypothetical protein E7393_04555 [Ruminococcaceae bacterium]|nr:hypothetical protein [Oscillospiraceae bacterium]
MKNKTALYLRLSRDDERASESESISNQRDFLMRYAQTEGLYVVDVFVDDGYSGTSFDRPDFNRLIAMIEEKKINTVLTKDLSRLGRDYIQTGYYLEQYFPLHNVRYIAVNDGIDTALPGAGNDMSPFRAVFNDMYARDISQKVRTALYTKKINGQFIGSRPPYGYQKEINNKNRLCPHEETALVVKKIFKWFTSGRNIRDIVSLLNQNNVPPPSARYQEKGEQRCRGWNDTMVKRILSNPTYVGDLTQNRVRKINYKVNRKISLPKDEWITVSATHMPLISREQFMVAERLLEVGSYDTRGRGKRNHLLSGLVFCRDCGQKMSFMNENRFESYLVCSNWRKTGKDGVCTPHSVKERELERLVFCQLTQIAMESNSTLFNKFNLIKPTRELLVMLVDRIYINHQKKVEIYFRFKNPELFKENRQKNDHGSRGNQ